MGKITAPTYVLKALGVAFVAVNLTFLVNCCDNTQQNADRSLKANEMNLRQQIRKANENSRHEQDKTV